MLSPKRRKQREKEKKKKEISKEGRKKEEKKEEHNKSNWLCSEVFWLGAMKLQHGEWDTTEISCDCFCSLWQAAKATVEGNPLLWANNSVYHPSRHTHTHTQRCGTSQPTFTPMPATPEIWVGTQGICKPAAEKEEVLQEGQAPVVLQVTHWSSYLRIHRTDLKSRGQCWEKG